MPDDQATDTTPAVTGVPPETPNAVPADEPTLADGPPSTDEDVAVHPTEDP